MFPKKHLSGCEKRKKRKKNEEFMQSQKGSMDRFIKPLGSVSNEYNDANFNQQNNNLNEETDNNLNQQNEHDTNISKEHDNNLNEHDISLNEEHTNLNDNLDIYDPRNWDVLDNKLRDTLIEKGPIRETNLVFPKDKFERHFSYDFYTRKLNNGETRDRKWLIYSKTLDKVFCFCCKLYKSSNRKSFLTNEGYNDWKHLNDRLKEHESSNEHLICMNSWNEAKQRLDKNLTIDNDLQQEILKEKERWRQVLRRTIAAVKFCREKLFKTEAIEELLKVFDVTRKAERVASAPGKVLMTGGYLVLERPNAGIVLSTNARFYAILKPLYDEVESDSLAKEWMDLKVNSPQMSRETTYTISLKDFTLESSSESRNPFVEYAVQYSIAAAYATLDKNKRNELHRLLLQGMDITIFGCNDFYSYRNQIEARGLPLTPESLAALPPFTSITFNAGESNVENCKPEVAKTGLGSSAAMTTAVVAALLHYLGVVDLSHSSTDEKSECSLDVDIVHMIAQTAHCIAQGKVGSGFDVSSAVYGSHRYVRFSPNVISSAQEAVSTTPLDEVIGKVLKGKWDHERTKFSLPPLMNLILGEPGSGGSSTPSMVGAVKKWQKSDPQKSQETWNKLSEANAALEAQFNLLSKLAAEHWDSYKAVIDSCSMYKSEKWVEKFSEASHVEIVKALLGARDIMLRIRCHMRQMGEAAGIPIEPESQTRLLDVTMDTEGVLLAGVPGAGGFDAVFAVTLSNSSTNLTKVWSLHNVLALLVREDPRGVSLETDDPRAK